MDISVIIRWIIILILVVVFVVHRLRKPKAEPIGPKKLSKEEEAKRSKRARKRDWKRQRLQAERDREEELKRKKWQSLLQEALPPGLGFSSREIGDLEIAFMGGGARPERQAVVLLHGLAADKQIWTGLGQQLVNEEYWVVAPDLPGFGDSTTSPRLQYDATSQTKRLRGFIRTLGLKTYHIVGAGESAAIAAACACTSPDEVLSVTLIEPTGVRAPGTSELDDELAKGNNPFILENSSSYDQLLSFLCSETPSIHEAIKATRAVRLASDRELAERVWRENHQGDIAFLLDRLLPEIPQMCLAIFGRDSRVLHPATAEIVGRKMQKVQTVVLDDCGHLPMVERPEDTARYLVRFLHAVRATSA